MIASFERNLAAVPRYAGERRSRNAAASGVRPYVSPDFVR
jgi:hypothetical protein